MPFSPVHKARKLSAVLGTTVAVVSSVRIVERENQIVPSLNCVTPQLLDAGGTRHVDGVDNLPARS